MYDDLVKRLRNRRICIQQLGTLNDYPLLGEAADAIEELQATLCNWCAVCPYDKRDLSTCEIYESCRAKPSKGEHDVDTD